MARRGEILSSFLFFFSAGITGEEIRTRFSTLLDDSSRKYSQRRHVAPRYYFRAKRKSNAASRADSAFSFVCFETDLKLWASFQRVTIQMLIYSVFIFCLARCVEHVKRDISVLLSRCLLRVFSCLSIGIFSDSFEIES